MTMLDCIIVFITGGHVRLYQETEYCLYNEAVFICIDDNEPVTLWKVSMGPNQVHLSLNSNLDVIGTAQDDMVASSALRVQLLSGNSSFIMSSLTIAEPLNLNGYTVNCNEEIIILNIVLNCKLLKQNILQFCIRILI